MDETRRDDGADRGNSEINKQLFSLLTYSARPCESAVEGVYC